MEEKREYKWLRNILIMLLCIAINYFGRNLSDKYSLPGWFDSYGTFFAAYIFGPVSGSIVGVTGNIIFAFWMPVTLVFATVSVFIGVGVGVFARKGYFETLFHSMTVSAAIAGGAVLMSSVIDFIVYDGGLGNIWGDGVKDYLMENGLPKLLAVLVGEMYLEFPDKLIAVIVMFVAIRFSRWLKKPHKKKLQEQLSEIKPLAVLLAAVIFVSQMPTVTTASAQSSENEENVSYIQTIYNGENGLPCGHANAIAQTNDGILWIGTYAGLYRYNGREFRHMSEFSEVRNVNCLYVDNEGRLWIGTNDNGVVIVIGGKVSNVINSKNGLAYNSIRAITQSSDGEYYIGASGGIVTVKLRKGIEIVSTRPDVGYVSRLTADSKGNVAAVNSDGQLYIMRSGRDAERLSVALKSGKLSCCNFSDDDYLYLGSTDGELLKFMISGRSLVRQYSVMCEGMTKINNIYPDYTKNIWVCDDSGIGYVNEEQQFVKQSSGSFDHSIENMEYDYQGNLWFASSRLGLLRLSRSPIADVFADTGIDPVVVNTTAIYNGLLYIGSDEGLEIADQKGHSTVDSEISEVLKGSRVRCLMPDSKGRLWICSYGKGLIVMNKDGSAENYTERFSDIGGRIRMCYELRDGSVAVSGSNGLYFFKDGAKTGHISYSEQFGYSQVLCLTETEDGVLYAGTDGDGISVIEKDHLSGRITREDGLTSDVILRLVDDPAGKGIIVITSNGIGYLEDGKVRSLSAFPYSNNYDAFIDDDGEMFVTGSAGVYVIDRQQLLDGELKDIKLIDSKSGLIGSLTANAWNALDGEKNLYLSADRGVFKLDLDNYKLKNRAFRLSVAQVRIDDEERQIERGTDFSIPRDAVKIEFCPEIINFTHDDPIVSYYLEGFDHGWNEVRQSELLWVPYTNLKSGNYVFHLAIRDENGKLLEESSYSFHKEKAIYDNYWFKYYMIGVAVLFIGWLSWFITRRQIDRTLKIQDQKLSMAMNQLRMGNETILAIAKTVDAKDVRTSKHSQRVSEYSAMIAAEYGFTEKEQDNLRKAALLHDIGKIGIPDSVLNKPSRLTDEEYAVMKTHVTRGAEILKDFTLIEHVVEGARYHHERYDGKGYPDGLKGEEIPLYGRIIAVADAFDAMTANRIYRKRQDFDYVMSELHKGRGTQFDPELLDIFLKLIDDKKIDIDALYQSVPSPEEEV